MYMPVGKSMSFEVDYDKLKHLKAKPHMSKGVSAEVITDHHRYEQLYPYFWKLIDANISQCTTCSDTQCYNRYFLKVLKNEVQTGQLTEKDLYLLTYMTTYFLDLIRAKNHTLPEAYYILSKGHNYVIQYVLGQLPRIKDISDNEIENYQGYLLSVLYYLLPDFKYPIAN
jgi:hypothetical protein